MKNLSIALSFIFLVGCDVPQTSDSSSSVKASSIQETVCDENTAPFGGGSGTSSDPYLICSVDQMKNLTGSYNAVYAELRSDLDYSLISFTMLNQFHGTFDGKNHTIKGINISISQSAGMFQSIAGTVKNLKLDSFSITGSNVGALAPDMNGTGYVENVHITNATINGNTSIGLSGLIIGESYGVIKSSTAIGSVTSKRAGGITGVNRGTLQYVASSVNLIGSIKGRIAGENFNDILDCQYPNFAQPGTNPVGFNYDDLVNCN